MSSRLLWLLGGGLACLFVWQVATAVTEPDNFDESRPAYVLEQQAGDTTVTLSVASAQSGANILLVRTEPPAAVDHVTLFPNMPGHEMLLLTGSVATVRTGAGEFRADTGAFEMFGAWDLVAEMTGPRGTQRATFQFQLAPSKPQIALFAGVPLAVLALALVTVVVMWRRSASAPPLSPTEQTVAP